MSESRTDGCTPDFASDQGGLVAHCSQLLSEFALSHSPDVAWILDYKSNRFSYASPHVEMLLGYTPHEATQLPLNKLFDPDSVGRVQDMMQSRLCEFGLETSDGVPQSGQYFTDTFGMTHRDGKIVWVEISGSLFQDESGEVSAAGIARDVTVRHADFLKLRDSEERYRLAIQNSVTGLVVLGPTGVVLEVSKPFCDMIGCDLIQIRGRHFADLIDEANQVAFGELLDQVVTGRSDTFRFRSRFHHKFGGYSWGDCSGVAVRRANRTVRYVIVRVADITAQTNAEDELTRVSRTWAVERERLRHTLDSVRDPIVLLEAVRSDSGEIVDFRFLDLNRASEISGKIGRLEAAGRLVSELYPAIHASGIQESYVRAIREQAPVSVSVDWGEGQPFEDGAKRFDIGIVPYGDTITATWRDVTEQYRYAKELAESEERYRLLTANLSGVVVKISVDDVVDWVSPSLVETLGWRADQWVGHKVTEFFHPDDLGIRQLVADEAKQGRPQAARWRVIDAQGVYHWAQFMARPYLTGAGVTDGMVGTFRIVDTEVAYERELERRARYDDLSGLLNRRSILDKVAGVVGEDRRGAGRMSAVLFCDIDLLKETNDAYGHAGGDALIVAVARRMALAVRESDSVGRIGGDEFLILLDGLQGLSDALAVAEKVRKSAHGAVALPDGTVIHPSLSIGIAITQPGEGVSALVERANTGLYDAKRGGRDRVVLIPDGQGG